MQVHQNNLIRNQQPNIALFKMIQYNKLCFIFFNMPQQEKISKNQKSMFHKLSENTVLLTTQIKLKYLLYPEYHFR